MNLLDRIMECKEEEVDYIIEAAIKEADANANQVEKLGFSNTNFIGLFKGFIPLNTRIKYSNLNLEDYGMQTTDFIYEFAHILRDNGIKTKGGLVHCLEAYINKYFGLPNGADREYVFNTIAWQTTTTDEEYFAALENNKIGDLKGKGAAECTERSAVAQQLLSIFGTETYYCMGCADLVKKIEGHCFNVVKRKNDYALLDYSVPVPAYKEDGSFKCYYPFVGELTEEEFLEFVNNGVIKTFDNYCFRGKERVSLDDTRRYVVGKHTLEETEDVKHTK